MNPYLEYLQETYSDPQQAYKAYILQKNIWSIAVYEDTAPEEIKKSCYFQEEINKFLLLYLSNPNITLSNFLNIKNGEEITFISQNIEYFEFLGLERSHLISLINGSYFSKLEKASVDIDSWNALNEIMLEEKYTKVPPNEIEVKQASKKLIEECGLNAFICSKAKSQLEIIKEIDSNVNQLAIVMECEKFQIGANKFTIVIDREYNDYAGYSNQYFNNTQQKLYLDSLSMNDAFAHEWLHGFDNLWAKHLKLSASHASEGHYEPIKELISKAKEKNDDILQEIKKHLAKTTLNHLELAVERYDRLGEINDKIEFRKMLLNEYELIMKNEWNREDFPNKFKRFKNKRTTDSKEAYMCTELEILNSMQNSQLNNSLFYEFAIRMDKNLVRSTKNLNLIGYSVEPCEQFARMYESYCDYILTQKGVKNTISEPITNFYIPVKEEIKKNLAQWDIVIKKMKELVNIISPIEKQKKFKVRDKKEVFSSIKKIRENIKEVEEVSKLKIK